MSEKSDPLSILLSIVSEQAEDGGVWFVAATAPEAYLQHELRRLHVAAEALRCRDDVYWDPFSECWVHCTKPVIVDGKNPPLIDPNVLYGDRYGVDWIYGEPDVFGSSEQVDR